MYKKQMKFQKIASYITLVAGLIVFIYALGIMTDLYDTLYSTMMDPSDLTYTTVPGSIVFYNMQGFNSSLLVLSIVLILSGALFFITQTQNRRRYYIGNWFALAIFTLVVLFLVIWGHIEIQKYRGQWLQVDFEALKRHATMFKQKYTDSTFWFDIHYFVFGTCLVSLGMMIYNFVWKVKLMKEEKRLLEEAK